MRQQVVSSDGPVNGRLVESAARSRIAVLRRRSGLARSGHAPTVTASRGLPLYHHWPRLSVRGLGVRGGGTLALRARRCSRRGCRRSSRHELQLLCQMLEAAGWQVLQPSPEEVQGTSVSQGFDPCSPAPISSIQSWLRTRTAATGVAAPRPAPPPRPRTHPVPFARLPSRSRGRWWRRASQKRRGLRCHRSKR